MNTRGKTRHRQQRAPFPRRDMSLAQLERDVALVELLTGVYRAVEAGAIDHRDAARYIAAVRADPGLRP